MSEKINQDQEHVLPSVVKEIECVSREDFVSKLQINQVLDPCVIAGPFGKFHKRYAFFVMCSIWFFSGAHTTIMTFVTEEPPRYTTCHSNISKEDICNPFQVLAKNDCSSRYLYAHPLATAVSTFRATPKACGSPWSLYSMTWSKSVFFLGFLIGVSIFGKIADWKGRFLGTYVSVLVMEISAFASGFSTSLIFFNISRAFVGMGVGGSGLLTYITLAEITGVSDRWSIPLFQSFSFALGAGYSCLCASISPSWRWLIFSIALPGLLCLCMFLESLRLESPRWLASTGNGVEALKTWTKIAETNNFSIPDWVTPERLVTLSQHGVIESDINNDTRLTPSNSLSPTEKGNADCVTANQSELDIVQRNKDDLIELSETFCQSLGKTPLSSWVPALAFLWFTANFCYYGIYLGESSFLKAHNVPSLLELLFGGWKSDKGSSFLRETKLLSTSVFYNFDRNDLDASFWHEYRTLCVTTFLTFILEIPMAVLSVYLASRSFCGRSGVIFGSFIMGGLLSLFAFFYTIGFHNTSATHLTLVVTIFANLSRLLVAAGFSMLYLYSSELLPTTYRSSILGICSMAGRVAGISAPFVVDSLDQFKNVFPNASLLVFGILCLIPSVIGLLILPETLGAPVHDSITTLRRANKERRNAKRNRSSNVTRRSGFFLKPSTTVYSQADQSDKNNRELHKDSVHYFQTIKVR